MKYLKLFKNDTDYQSYVNSDDYITPNVSYAEDTNIMYYNNISQLITFTIEGVEYQAEEGMTWEQWVDSEYNTGGFIINGGFIWDSQGGEILREFSNYVIIENYSYDILY